MLTQKSSLVNPNCDCLLSAVSEDVVTATEAETDQGGGGGGVLPALEEIHVVELVQLHGKLQCSLNFRHGLVPLITCQRGRQPVSREDGSRETGAERRDACLPLLTHCSSVEQQPDGRFHHRH